MIITIFTSTNISGNWRFLREKRGNWDRNVWETETRSCSDYTNLRKEKSLQNAQVFCGQWFYCAPTRDSDDVMEMCNVPAGILMSWGKYFEAVWWFKPAEFVYVINLNVNFIAMKSADQVVRFLFLNYPFIRHLFIIPSYDERQNNDVTWRLYLRSSIHHVQCLQLSPHAQVSEFTHVLLPHESKSRKWTPTDGKVTHNEPINLVRNISLNIGDV